MAATYFEFNTVGLFYGWKDEEIEQIDWVKTELKIISLLREVLGDDCTIVIKHEDGNDVLFGADWESPTEEAEGRLALADLPWYDAERWAVMKEDANA